MSQRAYIKLVASSTVKSVTLDELKDQLNHYKEQLAQTGSQLDWDYADAAFPYSIEQELVGKDKWFYLKGNNPLYRYIAFGVENPTSPAPVVTQSSEDEEAIAESPQAIAPCAIQVILPVGSTIGDKSKGNELCKYLGKIWKAEVHLFNGRIMYFNPRK